MRTNEAFFGNVMPEKQGAKRSFYVRDSTEGQTVYLIHNYFRIPKQAIRDNANFIVLFNQDTRNMRVIHDTFDVGDMTLLVICRLKNSKTSQNA